MPKSILACAAALMLLSLLVSIAKASLLDEVKACANTADKITRMACYESLGKEVLAAEASGDTKTETESEPEARTNDENALPADLGGGKFAKEDEKAPQSNRGRVTACQKNANRKWIYLFENGQVWAQVDSKLRRHKSCDFYVTVTKDGFGYQMLIDGEKRKIRISRRK